MSDNCEPVGSPQSANSNPLVLRIAAIFTPPGDDKKVTTDDFFAFSEIISMAKDEQLRKRRKELNSKVRALKKSILETNPGNSEITEIIQKAFDGRTKKSKVVQSDEITTARENWHKVSQFLYSDIGRGDLDSIEFLYELARDTTVLLMMVEKISPEIVRKISRKNWQFPVIATPEPKWYEKAKTRLASIELGEDATFLRSRFFHAAGADENNPARLWAKEAVRTIEQTFWRTIVFSHNSSELIDLVVSDRVFYFPDAEWYSLLSPYQPFSTESLPQWSKIVRALIRESVPDLHLREEWSNIRNSLKSRGLDTPGRIRAAILDDINSALKTIAPRSDLPKSTS